MPHLVEPPKITRPNAGPRGSKYVNEETLEETVKLLKDNLGTGWIGGLFDPVDTIIKARGAILHWRKALSDAIGVPEQAFATRVWQVESLKGGTEQYQTAIAIKPGVEIPEAPEVK